jgi:hypothetical protein
MYFHNTSIFAQQKEASKSKKEFHANILFSVIEISPVILEEKCPVDWDIIKVETFFPFLWPYAEFEAVTHSCANTKRIPKKLQQQKSKLKKNLKLKEVELKIKKIELELKELNSK